MLKLWWNPPGIHIFTLIIYLIKIKLYLRGCHIHVLTILKHNQTSFLCTFKIETKYDR